MALVLSAAGGTAALEAGIPVQITGTVTATGTANSFQFGALAKPAGGDFSLDIQAIKTAITVLTVDIEISLDGGTTFNVWQAGLDFAANGNQKATQPVYPGALYRLNVKTLTGTSVFFIAVVN